MSHRYLSATRESSSSRQHESLKMSSWAPLRRSVYEFLKLLGTDGQRDVMELIELKLLSIIASYIFLQQVEE